jgi:hypothetical protein
MQLVYVTNSFYQLTSGALNHFNGTAAYIIIPIFGVRSQIGTLIRFAKIVYREWVGGYYFLSTGKPFAFQSENPFSRLYTFLNPCFSM